jgi:PD-(D/E)XK endonuclease
MREKTGMGRGGWIKGCKERGEWAELCFMARAAGFGMGVMRPFGDSRRWDVAVEAGDRIVRVQVRSTIYKRRGTEYSLNMMGPGRKRYRPGSVDFFAVFLIPEDEWYIVPYAALGKKMTMHFGPRRKYARYLEAWELLGGKQIPHRDCVPVRNDNAAEEDRG